ncbi:MAG: hypothetical protein RR466_09780, partial [Hungatella sp.]
MKQRTTSLRRKLIVPLFFIMLIQALFFFGVVIYGTVSWKLKNNTVDILNENTENSKLYLEKDMVQHWIGVLDHTRNITDAIETILSAENCTATLHNLYTLRGAQVRDPEKWADYLDQTIDLFGEEATSIYSTH